MQLIVSNFFQLNNHCSEPITIVNLFASHWSLCKYLRRFQFKSFITKVVSIVFISVETCESFFIFLSSWVISLNFPRLPFKQCDQIWRNFAPCQKFTSLWQFLTVYFLFAKILSLLWQICDIIGLIFIFQLVKYWKII